MPATKFYNRIVKTGNRIVKTGRRPKHKFVYSTNTGHFLSSKEFLRDPLSKSIFENLKKSKLYLKLQEAGIAEPTLAD